MIYVFTVHFADTRWVGLQADYLSRFIKKKYKVYALLVNCDVHKKVKNYVFYRKKYNSEKMEGISFNHAKNMKFLVKNVLKKAKSKDILIFLDGDAFPIKGMDDYIQNKLSKFPLIAIQRFENDGDIQPHPAFCATTALFWKSINGDWRPGFSWNDCNGRKVSDSGGNLLKLLNEGGYKWYKLKRTNKVNLHPLFFGVYDDLVYHHGAGFRKPLSRYDMNNSKIYFLSKWLKDNQGNNIFNLYFFGILAGIFDYIFYKRNELLSMVVFGIIQIKNFINL